MYLSNNNPSIKIGPYIECKARKHKHGNTRTCIKCGRRASTPFCGMDGSETKEAEVDTVPPQIEGLQCLESKYSDDVVYVDPKSLVLNESATGLITLDITHTIDMGTLNILMENAVRKLQDEYLIVNKGFGVIYSET